MAPWALTGNSLSRAQGVIGTITKEKARNVLYGFIVETVTILKESAPSDSRGVGINIRWSRGLLKMNFKGLNQITRPPYEGLMRPPYVKAWFSTVFYFV